MLVFLNFSKEALDDAVSPLNCGDVLDHLKKRHEGVLLETDAIEVD